MGTRRHPHSCGTLRLDLYNVTCGQDASWQLSRCEGICGERNRDWGTQIGYRVSSWIYVSVREPFMRIVAPFPSDGGGDERGVGVGGGVGSHVGPGNCCANISALLVHLLASTEFAVAATSVPTQCRRALHLSSAQRKTQTQ